jgi:hypothetical protein
MSDDKKPAPRVRRVGEKDRKTQIDSGGPLFPPGAPPPSGGPPPTLPEAPPDPDETLTDVGPETGEEIDPVELAAQASAGSALDEDAEALLAELETEFGGYTSSLADETVPDEHERFRPPAPPRDRFPPLPEEYERYAPVQQRPRTQPPPPPRKRSGAAYNLLTVLFLLSSCGLTAYFAFLWRNPYSALNMFPPFTPPPIIVSETYIPTITYTPSETPTPIPTDTPLPTITPTPPPTEPPEPVVEATAAPGFAFALQGGRAIFVTNPDGRGGCNWSSIAGTVADANGQALNGYQIRILGEAINETVISGTAPGYGPGGFELQVGNEAVDAEFAVQLLDPAGTPVSDVITTTTNSRCDWNISVLRFIQNSP